jgi:hypothetical protein
MTTAMNEKQMLTTDEAAGYLGVAGSTLAGWRTRGQQGPPYIKLVGAVRYRLRDLETWLDKYTVVAREDLGDEAFD